MSRIRYHAAARELAGCSDETLELGTIRTADELRALIARRHPRLGPYLARMRFAVDGELVDDAMLTLEGALEIDVLPPVAGGAPNLLAEVRDTPLSIDEVFAAVRHPEAGGVCLFVGVVRNHAEGKPVGRLDYEAHPTLASRETLRVLEQIQSELPGVRLAAVHRVGELTIGDLAVVVAASAPHRAEAFEACRRAIDRIKETVPIWKKEYAPSGEAVWVNLGEPSES
jgi:MoaE-MoaD fusion protein